MPVVTMFELPIVAYMACRAGSNLLKLNLHCCILGSNSKFLVRTQNLFRSHRFLSFDDRYINIRRNCGASRSCVRQTCRTLKKSILHLGMNRDITKLMSVCYIHTTPCRLKWSEKLNDQGVMVEEDGTDEEGDITVDTESDNVSKTRAWEDSSMFHDEYLHPCEGHKVLILQPDISTSRKAGRPSNRVKVSPEQQLEEALGLVQALPDWCVLSKEVVRMAEIDQSRLFTKGIYAAVRSLIHQCQEKTAVFVNISMLTSHQLSTLQKEWGVPVYDRFTIILQIFHDRARTREAKLQVALAEIPYYRSRLDGMHSGTLRHQRGGLNYMGGDGETKKETRHRCMAEKELGIRKKLKELKSQRCMLRKERRKKELPLVAVVGYTNAGKTSVIKRLSQDVTMAPRDQVFATLDVTCHGGLLSNLVKVVYVDTVGFISDIPASLIQSFSATLEDTAHADVIMHVRDASRPDTELQKMTVLQTLSELNLPRHLVDNIIEVNNKVDLMPRETVDLLQGVRVSTVTGEGLHELLQLLEQVIMALTGRVNKLLKVPQAGPHLSWLYQEATVTTCRSCDHDPESLLVEVVMTTAVYDKFCARFQRKKITKR